MQLLSAQFKHGKSWSSRETMGKWLDNKKPRMMSYYIKELKDKDLVEVKKVKGKTNEYKAKEIKMDLKKTPPPPATDCNTTPAIECNHKNNKRSLRTKDKEIYKESLNYTQAQSLVNRYVTEIKSMPPNRKKRTDIASAEKQLTKRLDRGEDLARFEKATVNAIKAQSNGFDPKYMIGPRNFYSTMKSGGKYAQFLEGETEELYASVFGEENE